MRYVLERLELSFDQHVKYQNQIPDHEQTQIILGEINAEKEMIKSYLKQEVFTFQEEKRLELFVQQYQSALIRLANEVFNFNNKDLPALNALAENYLQAITDLLFFIENYFTRYFNLNEQIPDSYKYIMQAKCKQYIKAISKTASTTSVCPELLKIILKVFNDFIKASSQKNYTYTQIIYLKKLYAELADSFNSTDENCNQIILDKLLYLNFNSAEFVSKYVQHILSHVADASSLKDQLELLAWWSKTIKQTALKPGMVLLSSSTAAQAQLIGWLQDEIHFLEKKNQLTLLMPTAVAGHRIKNPALKTDFSVKQLGLFIRLMVDEKILQPLNQTELVNQIASLTTTDNQEVISAHSLRRHYYTIDEHTKDKMKARLISMMNQIKKYNNMLLIFTTSFYELNFDFIYYSNYLSFISF